MFIIHAPFLLLTRYLPKAAFMRVVVILFLRQAFLHPIITNAELN